MAAQIIDSTPAATAPEPPCRADRRLLVNTIFRGSDVSTNIGIAAYSYYFVYRAYQPLLAKYAKITEIPRPESQIDFALRKATLDGLEGIFLTFLPLQNVYLSTLGPVVAYPFWEFPDIPSENFENNPRNNWVRIAKRLSLIFTACEFTKQAFRRAGIQTPIQVLPVPVQERYFQLPVWDPKAVVTVGCTYWPLEDNQATAAPPPPPDDADPPPPPPPPPRFRHLVKRGLQALRATYKQRIKPWVPRRIAVVITHLVHAVAPPPALPAPAVAPAGHGPPTNLQLSGAVYTSIFNPFDRRKNWTDMLSAFLLALGPREDATLVLKLVVPREHEHAGVQEVANYYRGLDIRHKCRVVLIATYLTDEQMMALCWGSAFYLNASKAEGACLPLQDFLAAGRPGLAPRHTAMADYFDAGVGFVVEAQPEPTFWPHDPRHAIRTTWYRIDWQSLHDQIRDSYRLLYQNDGEEYREMALRARARMEEYASLAAVWPRLVTALNALESAGGNGRSQKSVPAPAGAPVEATAV